LSVLWEPASFQTMSSWQPPSQSLHPQSNVVCGWPREDNLWLLPVVQALLNDASIFCRSYSYLHPANANHEHLRFWRWDNINDVHSQKVTLLQADYQSKPLVLVQRIRSEPYRDLLPPQLQDGNSLGSSASHLNVVPTVCPRIEGTSQTCHLWHLRVPAGSQSCLDGRPLHWDSIEVTCSLSSGGEQSRTDLINT